MALLSHHYRSAWTFSEEEMDGYDRENALFKEVWLVQSGPGDPLNITDYERGFLDAMNDDFNTPLALETLREIAVRILENKDRQVLEAKTFLNRAFNILGLVVEY
jgi:cysteinyl-tRNA synthetase